MYMRDKIRQGLLTFGLLLKERAKAPSVYLLGACCLLFLLGLRYVIHDGSEQLSYGVVNEAAECGPGILEELEKMEDPYTLVILDDREELKRNVEAGRLDCGFILYSGLDEMKGLDDLEECAGYICSTSTGRGMVLREKVFASILKVAAEKELFSLATDGGLFAEDEEDAAGLLRKNYHEFLEGTNTLQVIFEILPVEGTPGEWSADRAVPEETRKEKTLALCRLLLFAASLVFAAGRFSERYKGIRSGLQKRRRIFFQLSAVFAPMLIAGGILLGGFFSALGSLKLLTAASAAGYAVYFLGYSLLCAFWSGGYAGLFSKQAAYLGSLPGVIILSVLTEDALLKANAFLPALKVLGYLIPG